MRIAAAETGVTPCGPGESNPRITAYHHGTNLQGYDDKVAWCSSFANWCMAESGLPGTGSGLARSWLDWGTALNEPVPGCIVVLQRGRPDSWTGHVGFYLRTDAGHVHLLGGNQLASVCEHAYPLAHVLAYRWPSGVPIASTAC